MFRSNDGYIEFSMSVAAKNAYDNGESPISNWTKSKIMDAIENEYGKEYVKEFSIFPLYILKSVLLSECGWHHTSKYYNKTIFYYLPERDKEEIENALNECKERLKNVKNKKKKPEEKPIEKRAKCIYIQWSGTRNYPKAIIHETVGTIKGNWFYPDGEDFKKSIKATGFIIKEFLGN